MSGPAILNPGRPIPLGATPDGDGTNFSVFSAHATQVTLSLFDATGSRERHRLNMIESEDGIWHGFVPGVGPGQMYGYRVDGPYDPASGHRFNQNKMLIDPYARRLAGALRWDDSLMGYTVGHPLGDLSFDVRDSFPFVPRSVVERDQFDWGDDAPPGTAMADSVIYEAHVKGFTQRLPGVAEPGRFLGLASDPAIEHLVKLGITAIELLPAQAFIDDGFIASKGLTNYWGYQTLGFFAPEPRYMSNGQIAEFQHMVKRLHEAGIEVLMDVVYNHTCEGDELGPTLAFRGLDNASYYRLAEDKRRYINDTGTGNTLNVAHPMVTRMVLDSLRYWVEVMHVDGFRFDLCATLGRTETGFDPGGAFFSALLADPVLSKVKLIAEPWDIGPGGYQLGAFRKPFSEWNDAYRDDLRRFWRGDDGGVPALAHRVAGSASQFDHSGRGPAASVNFLTAHDGFTLMDVVSYNQRQNLANGEGNRDGHGENLSDNMGVEGPSDDPDVVAARARRRRAMLASLLLSQGVPMLLSGDEIGHTQSGNNNAYAQDNQLTWLDWSVADDELCAFVAKVIGLRMGLPVLRQDRFLHGEPAADGVPNLIWRRADGAEMTNADWNQAEARLLCAEMRMRGDAPGTPVHLSFNAGDAAVDVTLPLVPDGQVWCRHLDTGAPSFAPEPVVGEINVDAQSVVLCVLEPQT